MISEPKKEVLEATDWRALNRLLDRVDELRISGKMDEETFREIWAEGLKATNNHPELLQSIAMSARPEWIPKG